MLVHGSFHPGVLVSPELHSPEKIQVALLNCIKAVALPFLSLLIFTSAFHCRMAEAVR